MSNYFQTDEQFEIIQPKVVRVKSAKARISDVAFPADTRYPVFIGFNFLAENAQLQKEYTFRVNQYLSSDSSYLGSETYIINKGSRTAFFADAGTDIEIDYGQSATLNATTINELAIYNWYNSTGVKLGEGTNINVSPTNDERYKLEVIAEADGTVDYDYVEVNVLHHKIDKYIS